MDKLNELLQDQNNKIIAIAILIVIILGVVVLVGLQIKNKNASNGSATSGEDMEGMGGMPGAMGPDGMGGMPGAMGPNGMGGMPGATGMGDMPGAMGPEGMDGSMPSATNESTTQVASTSNGKPIEVGRIDPFAPIGVAKASKTKTFGNAIKSRLFREGISFRLPSNLEAISFTDYQPGVTRIGYIKTAADYKREKDKQTAKENAEKKKIQDKINTIIYQKPTTIRLAGISKGKKGRIAQFEVYLGNRSDYETVSEGDAFTYGYNGMKELKAKVKDVSEKSAILVPENVNDIEWKYNLTDGSSRNQNGYGNQMDGMNGMGMNPMGGMNGMNPMGGMNGMNGMGMNPMGGMNGMNGMGMNPMGGMNGMNGMGMNPMGGMNGMNNMYQGD